MGNEVVNRKYVHTGRCHPETVVRWFLDTVHYWFDESLGPNLFTGMRDDAEKYLSTWVETGEFPPDETTLEIHTRRKFEEWLASSWRIWTPSASIPSPLIPERTAVRAQQLFDQWLKESGLSGWLNPDFGGWKTLIDRIASELMTVTPSPSIANDMTTDERFVEQMKADVQADGKMDFEQRARAMRLAESRGIDDETAHELVYLRDRKIAEKIAEIMSFDVDVCLDANGTRVQDIIASGFATTPPRMSPEDAKLLVLTSTGQTELALRSAIGDYSFDTMVYAIAANATTPIETEKRGREMFAAELLNHLDRITSTTAAFHLVKSLCLIEVGRNPNTLGVEIDEEAAHNND